MKYADYINARAAYEQQLQEQREAEKAVMTQQLEEANEVMAILLGNEENNQ